MEMLVVRQMHFAFVCDVPLSLQTNAKNRKFLIHLHYYLRVRGASDNSSLVVI